MVKRLEVGICNGDVKAGCILSIRGEEHLCLQFVYELIFIMHCTVWFITPVEAHRRVLKGPR